MNNNMVMKKMLALVVCFLIYSVVLAPHPIPAQEWSELTVQSLPDSSFAMVELDKNNYKTRHLPYRDVNGNIDFEQLIYCLGTFSSETWIDTKNREVARKTLEEQYYRFKLDQLKEGIKEPVNINKAKLRELVKLPNIGPVTAVKIYKFRDEHGPLEKIEDIKNVEGIGPSTFNGIRYYITIR